MLNESAIFHRTDAGRNAIQHKTYELTQSERLVLIVVDGGTSCSGLRQKLKGLAEERFNRALNTLLKKELVVEITTPISNNQIEQLDAIIVDRFLQQDPLDPVTAIFVNSENTIDPNKVQIRKKGRKGRSTRNKFKEKSPYKTKLQNPVRSMRITKVDIYLPLERSHNTIDLNNQGSAKKEGSPANAMVDVMHQSPHAKHDESKRVSKHVQWGHWIVFAGLIFIMIFEILQNTR